LASSGCELNQIFGDLAARVPDGPPGYPDFVFHAGVLPTPPTALATDRILIRKTTSQYNSCYRADLLYMNLGPRKCRELGVFLLACGFHGPAETTTLSISHPESDIRRIIIPGNRVDLSDLPVGLSTKPFALRYFPAETERHPWLHDCCTHDLPRFALSNAEDCVATEEDWRARDSIWVDASSPGAFRFAELLLNAGCSWNTVREYALEGDAGYRGVAPMSAELRILLPGSDLWIYEGEDVPVVVVSEKRS
jgi:hypothetical protein